ncbi:type II secretion system F family protein [Idiomarina sp. Sol25]|uniref:type II secretion system F family protein n=1 Tax=Idiomarina TaxID=135575 RepID=UPI00294B401B|nr:type II secretion system F family protein [Idiomarina sp. Sol25]MDV6326601.1 type II secretion system F family protein [Idiomarina sp. Sol25]
MIIVAALIFLATLSFSLLVPPVWQILGLGQKLDYAVSKIWSVLPENVKRWTVRYLEVDFLKGAGRSFCFWVFMACVSVSISLLSGFWLLSLAYILLLLMIINKRRQLVLKNNKAIVRQLPDFCDLISMMIASGIPLISALEKVSASCSDLLLAREITSMLSRLRRGTSFAQSMDELNERYDAKQLHEWTSMLIKGYQQGTSLTKSLRFYANQLRQDLLNSAEKRAQEAPVKLLFPLVTCFFPVNFLVILGPVIVQISQGGFG